MDKKFQILISAFIIYSSCNSPKEVIRKSGTEKDPIQTAILDFKKSKFYKRNSVFSVSFYDTLYQMELIKNDNNNFKWIKGKFNEELLAVLILPSNFKLPITKNIKPGVKGKLPSRYFEENGKLFYWWDDEYPLNEQTLEIFKKYNILQIDNGNGLNVILNNPNIDDEKGVHYFFCRKNISRYKKIITSTGIGYYDFPVLNCN